MKYLFKGLAWGAGVLVAVYLVVCVYVTLNKNSIIDSISRDISEKIRGEVTIGSSDLNFFRSFPNVAVLLKDVKVSDSLFPSHGKYFISGKEVFLRLSISRLIKKQPPVKGIHLKHASINVFTNLDGYTNRYLLKQKGANGSKGSSGKLYLEKILLDDVTFRFSDSIKGKYHSVNARNLTIDLNEEGNTIKGKCEMDLGVGGIVFNPFKGGYLEGRKVSGKFPIQFNRESGKLIVQNIALRVDDQTLEFSGSFDLAGNSRAFNMNVHAKSAEYNKLKILFPEKIRRSLSLVQLDGRIDATADIGGSLLGGDPLVIVKFSSRGTSMLTPFMDFKDASFSGQFTNEVVKGLPRKDPNSRIILSGFAASWRGIPLSATVIQVDNLKDPVLTCNISSRFSLSRLNEVMESESLLWKEGESDLELRYSGPLVHDARTPALMSGKVHIRNGSLTYLPRKVDMKKVRATVRFEHSNVFLDSFTTEVFGKRVNMSAEAAQLLTLLNTQPNAALVKWNIDVPDLDLAPYMILLKKKQPSAISSGSKIMKTSAKIDRVLDEGQLDVNLRIGKLQFKKFVARNVESSILFLQDRYVIHDARFDHADGAMQLKGSLVQGSDGVHHADIQSSLKNVDVRKVFAAFANFGQDGLRSENISGNLDAVINAKLRLFESGQVIPSSTSGTVKFSLKQGELIDFEPVKKIQQFIFKNRDFENIRFAELKNTLEIKGQDIYINPMEIQSSVLTMFVQGVYSSAGNTDMQIRLPLSNLKRRGKDFNPENIGAGGKRGSSVFLRGKTGDDGNIRFKLDLFNKFGKENKTKRK